MSHLAESPIKLMAQIAESGYSGLAMLTNGVAGL